MSPYNFPPIHHSSSLILIIIIIIIKALQLRGSFGLLNEFSPFGPVSDAVLPVSYSQVCYIKYNILQKIMSLSC